MHLETTPDPQYTLLILSRGSVSAKDSRTTVRAAGRSIIRSSYHKYLSLDFDHSAALTIRTSIPLLLNALNIAENHKDNVTERLLDTDLEQLPQSIGSIDYYGTIRAVVRMIDAADGDADQLERIGFHKLLTRIIAEFTLRVDRRLSDL